MAKEILLYDGIYPYTARNFREQLTEASDEDVSVRILSRGGDPGAGYTILAAMQEHGNISIAVDGYADSMAAFMLCYANGTTCLDTTSFTFHRAAYVYERDMSEADTKELKEINEFARKGIEDKVGAEKWEQVTGVSLDAMFSMDSRIDVNVNAEQAKEMGLVDKVVPVTQTIINKVAAQNKQLAAAMNMKVKNSPKPEAKNKPKQKNPKKMTEQEIKDNHPEVYASIAKAGANKERDRAEAWLAFNDIDPEAVKEGIASGESIGQKAMAEFTRKGMNAENLQKVTADSTKPVSTEEKKPEAEKDEKEVEAEKEKENFLNAARSNYKHILKTEK